MVNIESIAHEMQACRALLAQFNVLLHSPSIAQEFKELVTESPQLLEQVPWLLGLHPFLDADYIATFPVAFNSDENIDNILAFLEQTGVFAFLEKGVITHVEDYALGVAVGRQADM